MIRIDDHRHTTTSTCRTSADDTRKDTGRSAASNTQQPGCAPAPGPRLLPSLELAREPCSRDLVPVLGARSTDTDAPPVQH
mmetsp:Transcript_2438/g.9332  ORF Transcript_2438/g.9332 Transcript_2438/m.9332 type:complete len:81 (-) Transcript_2438:32-274(-)